jgi:hypothetical protein
VDSDGEFRCWNCGNKGLLAKRTFRSKMLVGVGALLTKKKLKCQTCGEYNDTGSAKPFTGPASRKWRKRYEQEQAAKSSAEITAEQRAAEVAAAAIVDQLAQVAAQQSQRSSSGAAHRDELPAPGTVPPPPPPSHREEPVVPASWQDDLTGRHQLRYWDGTKFTEHVSDDGVQGIDPLE